MITAIYPVPKRHACPDSNVLNSSEKLPAATPDREPVSSDRTALTLDREPVMPEHKSLPVVAWAHIKRWVILN
jgi:hypothetical protein